MLVNFRVLAAGVLAALVVMNTTAAPVPADRVKAEKEMATVVAKLHGSWQGGPCEGRMTFRRDRTYEWSGRGPGGESDKGVWILRGDATQPTLVMECKESDNPDRAGKSLEVSLIRVDDENLVLKYANEEQPRTYPRYVKGLPRTK